MEPTILSTYKIRVTNRRSETFNLMGLFNDKDDILPELVEFLLDIYSTPVQTQSDEEKNTFLNLGLVNPPVVLKEERVIHGYFDAGVSGQEINVKNRHTRDKVFTGDRDTHGLYRQVFFYIKLPFKSDSGYLILQRKARFGVKDAFSHFLKVWFRKYFPDTVININAVIAGNVFDKMMAKGSLKKINFLVNHLPSDIRDLHRNNNNPSLMSGTTVTTIKSNAGLSPEWIKFARFQLSKEKRNTLVEFDSGEKEYDEIQFEVASNGRRKTFHVNNKDRTVPDIDVTDEIKPDRKSGEPLLSSLLEKCEEIVKDTFELKPDAESH